MHRATFRAAVYVILHRTTSSSVAEIMLMRRYNTGFGDGQFSFIAGHVEEDELSTATAVREAKEEAGIVLEPADLTFAHILHRQTEDNLTYFDFFFIARRWQGVPTVMEPDKCDGLRWAPITALPENTLPYIRHTVHEIFGKQTAFSEFARSMHAG